MTTTQVEIRRGAYYDSIVLMHLQAALAGLDGILQSGVAMGTPSNKALLAQSGLTAPEIDAARPDDLVIAVQAESDAAALAALAQVDHTPGPAALDPPPRLPPAEPRHRSPDAA